MGIDYVIGYGCVPKEHLTSEGIIERLKAGKRAATLIDFYRQNNDNRPVEEMGGEFTRRSADGEEITEVIRVDDLQTQYAVLDEYAEYCQGCPANVLSDRFGCVGNINYPISQAVELWLLHRLPDPTEALPFLLLTKAEEFGLTGETARGLRDNVGIIFQDPDTLGREYPEMKITTDQLFELMFLLGPIQPKRAVMILMYTGAIQRDLEADAMMALTPAPPDAAERFPFLLRIVDGDDASMREYKRFLLALYTAWTLDRELVLDV